MVGWSTPTPRIAASPWLRCVSHAKPDCGLISHNAKRKRNRCRLGYIRPVSNRTNRDNVLERLNQKLEFSLGAGPVYRQQPSDPQRLRLFVRTIDELRRQVEAEGLMVIILTKSCSKVFSVLRLAI